MANVKITDLTAASAAAKSMLFEVTQDPAGTPASRKLSLTQLFDLNDGTKTSSAPILNLAQTWNSGVTTFTAMKINVTDTASAASSLLLDLQVGGSSVFTFTKESRIDCLYAVFGGFMYSPAIRVSSDTGELTFGSSIDLYLRRDAANTLAQRNGTNAQAFRLYNTYTDASNYERGNLTWSSTANYLMLETKAGGTGSARPIWINAQDRLYFTAGGGASAQWNLSTSGHWLASTDNTYDIGASGATRPRNLYVAGLAVFGGTVTATSYVASSVYTITSKLRLSSPSDGLALLQNSAANDFDRLQFGGTTSSFPAIKRSSASLQFRLADDSASAAIEALTVAATSNGSTSAPSFIFAGRGTDTGIYSASSTSIGFTIAGSVSHRFFSDGSIYTYNDASSLTFGAATDLSIFRDAANTLAQRNGTTAQTLRVYNTYTDGSNYERGVFDWGTTSNVLTIGTQNAGTGSARNIDVVVGGVRKLDYGITFSNWWSISESLFVGNAFTASGAITGNPSYSIGWSGATLLHSSSDGVLRLTNNAGTSFDRIQLGGTTSSFPAIKRDSAGIKFVVADDSASADIECLSLKTGAPSGGTAAKWKGGVLVTAAVTPDTTRYIELDVAGTLYKVIVST